MDASLHGRRMGVGGEITLSRHVKVKAFDSTDEGLSYLVEMDGIRIFHAGDLNNWHWREESTPREIEEAERDFQQVMETMRGEKVDVAFFPVDPRLGMMFDAGPNYFAMVVKPRLMIPMHFWERAEVMILAVVCFQLHLLVPGDWRAGDGLHVNSHVLLLIKWERKFHA